MGIIVAERINATRSRIAMAIRERDEKRIRREARSQAAAGATHIDINAGLSPESELEDLLWLAQTVQAAVELPLSIDTANPAVATEVIKVVRWPPLVNSISGEKQRLEGMLPLLAESNASVVALCMDDTGLPTDASGRLKVAARLCELLSKSGIKPEHIYFDPLVRPVSTNPEQVAAFLEATRRIQAELPGVHTICGMSNVSFGLPGRNHLNRAFMVLALAAGMDSFILDPTEEGVMAAYFAARALLERDQFCLEYIQYFRQASKASEEHAPGASRA